MAELHDNSPAVMAAMQRAAIKALEMCGGIGESAVKQKLTNNGSVVTGLLRNSITYALGGQGAKATIYHANRAKGGAAKANGQPGAQQDVATGTYQGQAPADEKGQMSVYVGTNVEYAPHVELGTVKMNAKPYLRPAIEGASGQFEKAYALAFQELN